MYISRAYLVGNTRCSFRSGEAAKITGTMVVKPDSASKPRLCFQIEFKDGQVDYTPVEEFYNGNVEIRYSFKNVSAVLDVKLD